jgi:hypothetical protein
MKIETYFLKAAQKIIAKFVLVSTSICLALNTLDEIAKD